MNFKKSIGLLALLSSACAVSSAHAAPTIITVTPATLNSAIKAQKGKVVLVNFWATWCAPCVKELPELGKVQKQFGKRGVTVLLVSTDDPSSKALISTTLTKKGQGKTYLVKGDMVEFFNKFDPKFTGAIAMPHSYIYNRKGVRVKSIPMDHTAAQYGKMLTPYL